MQVRVVKHGQDISYLPPGYLRPGLNGLNGAFTPSHRVSSVPAIDVLIDTECVKRQSKGKCPVTSGRGGMLWGVEGQ